MKHAASRFLHHADAEMALFRAAEILYFLAQDYPEKDGINRVLVLATTVGRAENMSTRTAALLAAVRGRIMNIGFAAHERLGTL